MKKQHQKKNNEIIGQYATIEKQQKKKDNEKKLNLITIKKLTNCVLVKIVKFQA